MSHMSVDEELAREIYEEDEEENGCGYWSVCVDHACPCHPNAKVSQGFDYQVYRNLLEERQNVLLPEEAEYYDEWPDDDDYDDPDEDWDGDDPEEDGWPW